MECVLQNWLFLHSLFLHSHISYHSPGLQTDWKDLQVDIHLVALEALDFQVGGGRIFWLKQLGSGTYGSVRLARCVPETV